jgi:hypothetical protein
MRLFTPGFDAAAFAQKARRAARLGMDPAGRCDCTVREQGLVARGPRGGMARRANMPTPFEADQGICQIAGERPGRAGVQSVRPVCGRKDFLS